MAKAKPKYETPKRINKKLKPLEYKRNYRDLIKAVNVGDFVRLVKIGNMTHEGRQYKEFEGFVVEKLPKAVVLDNGTILPWWTIYNWEIL